MKAAIVDMVANQMTSYVSFTRVKKKEDLLIYRPFDLEIFRKGDQEGPNLLLRVLRGDDVDWKEIEMKHMPSHRCSCCGDLHFKSDFTAGEWSREDKIRYRAVMLNRNGLSVSV